MKVQLKNEPYLKAIVRMAFPDYRKRDVHVAEFRPGMNVNSYWDGGSKTEYAIVHLPTLAVRPLPTSTHPYFDVAGRGAANQETADIASDAAGNVTLKRLPAEFALVYVGIYCGQPGTATIMFAAEQAQATIAVAQRRLLAAKGGAR